MQAGVTAATPDARSDLLPPCSGGRLYGGVEAGGVEAGGVEAGGVEAGGGAQL